MLKDRKCQFHELCKLLKTCSGCGIPEEAKQWDDIHEFAKRNIFDTDCRGISERAEIYAMTSVAINSEGRYAEEDDV